MAERKHPDSLSLICPAGLVLAAGGDGNKLPTFAMVAYTGGPMRVPGWIDPVVIDLAGVTVPTQKVAIRRNHDNDRTIGHTDSVAVSDAQITATGVISFDTEAAREVVTAAKNGFPWQSSVGMSPDSVEFVPSGSSMTVNGRMRSGPVDIIRRSTLREITIVDLGADSGTSVLVAASSKENEMPGKVKDDEQVKPVEAGGSVKPADVGPVPAKEALVNAEATVLDVASMRKQAGSELKRQAAIQKVAAKHPEIAAKAIEEGWTEEKTELECMRAARPPAPAIAGGQAAATGDVLEAAICASAKLPNLEKRFPAATIDAADKRFKRRIGLQDALLEAAYANGFSGRSFKSDPRGVLEAAFSTFSLPGILSNAANKFLLDGFMGVEQAWRPITDVRSVSDFKTITSYRLNGGFEYEEIPADGEFKHGVISEQSFTNRAKTYGKMFQITRQDLINDDLGALTDIPKRIGRGAALKLNKVFWTEFMNNASFFAAGNNNYFEGATTNLSIASLTTALQKFRDQTDPDGNPIALQPMILLVPPALEVLAKNLMNSIEVRDNTASLKYGVSNPFSGMFTVLVSTYLSNALIPGYSSTAWYLLANPSDMATIQTVFLNGVETPTTETAEADFNVLGIQMRGYHDFGVAKQEYRAGVKSKGAA